MQLIPRKIAEQFKKLTLKLAILNCFQSLIESQTSSEAIFCGTKK